MNKFQAAAFNILVFPNDPTDIDDFTVVLTDNFGTRGQTLVLSDSKGIVNFINHDDLFGDPKVNILRCDFALNGLDALDDDLIDHVASHIKVLVDAAS